MSHRSWVLGLALLALFLGPVAAGEKVDRWKAWKKARKDSIVDRQVTKTTDGKQVTTQRAWERKGGEGSSTTVRDVQRTENGKTWSGSTTGTNAKGKSFTASGQGSTVRSDGTATRTGTRTVTQEDGRSRTIENQRVSTKNDEGGRDWTHTRTVTNDKGQSRSTTAEGTRQKGEKPKVDSVTRTGFDGKTKTREKGAAKKTKAEKKAAKSKKKASDAKDAFAKVKKQKKAAKKKSPKVKKS